MELVDFYTQVARDGMLMTPEIGARWTTAVLSTLGLNVDKKVKKQLVSALPEELGLKVGSSFNLYNALLGIRDTNISAGNFKMQLPVVLVTATCSLQKFQLWPFLAQSSNICLAT